MPAIALAMAKPMPFPFPFPFPLPTKRSPLVNAETDASGTSARRPPSMSTPLATTRAGTAAGTPPPITEAAPKSSGARRCGASSNGPPGCGHGSAKARCVASATGSSGDRANVSRQHPVGHAHLAADAQQPGVERARRRRLEVRAGRVRAERQRLPVAALLHGGSHLAHLGVGRMQQPGGLLEGRGGGSAVAAGQRRFGPAQQNLAIGFERCIAGARLAERCTRADATYPGGVVGLRGGGAERAQQHDRGDDPAAPTWRALTAAA